jgi:hypothetical protein
MLSPGLPRDRVIRKQAKTELCLSASRALLLRNRTQQRRPPRTESRIATKARARALDGWHLQFAKLETAAAEACLRNDPSLNAVASALLSATSGAEPPVRRSPPRRQTRASGACTLAANGRVDAEVSADDCRATGSTNIRHSRPLRNGLIRLLLPAGSSSRAERSCSCSPTSISIWIPAALLRAETAHLATTAFAIWTASERTIPMATMRACGPDRRRPVPTCALLGRPATSRLSRSTDRDRREPAPCRSGECFVSGARFSRKAQARPPRIAGSASTQRPGG